MTEARSQEPDPDLHRHGQARLRADLKYAAVALDLAGRADGLERVVGKLNGRAAVGRDHLADEGERVEAAVGAEAAEVVGQKRTPAIADAQAPVQMAVDALDALDIEPVGEDRQLLL